MTIEIKAPTLPESVPDGTIANWYKNVGDTVMRDELLVDIETDKVVIEVVSPTEGTLKEILMKAGTTIVSNQAIGTVLASEGKQAPVAEKAEPVAKSASNETETMISPAAKKLIEENSLNVASIAGSGKDGRITKEDILKKLEPSPMSRLRSKVAERLLHASQSTAMLTTFNEVNMKPVMDIRNRYKEEFEKAHDGTRLGFMSFFVRACTEALKRYPAVNASLDGEDVVYHGYQDIGVAVSSPRGLVVPVLRNVDSMGLAQVEKEIRNFGLKARDGKLSIDEMLGGTFTISNGGVFGSLLSTPILNPPQTAILGMHKIQERPMAVSGKVVVLPMMYLALSYDHRMIDGKEAVQFLVTVKELLEDPTRLLLEI